MLRPGKDSRAIAEPFQYGLNGHLQLCIRSQANEEYLLAQECCNLNFIASLRELLRPEG
jgi:hypothetical protein